LIDMRPNRSRGPSGTGTPTTTPRGAWDEPRRPHTNVDEPWALRLLINAAVADAARQLGGSEEAIEGLLDRWLERAVDEVAWATSVSARFHVARASRDGADSGRTQERKRRTSVRPTAEDAESTGAMWPFRQRPAAHKPSAWELVARVFP
jgi:hypothetical protein